MTLSQPYFITLLQRNHNVVITLFCLGGYYLDEVNAAKCLLWMVCNETLLGPFKDSTHVYEIDKVIHDVVNGIAKCQRLCP